MTERARTDTLETIDADALAGVGGGFVRGLVDRCPQELPDEGGGKLNAVVRAGKQLLCQLGQPRYVFS